MISNEVIKIKTAHRNLGGVDQLNKWGKKVQSGAATIQQIKRKDFLRFRQGLFFFLMY